MIILTVGMTEKPEQSLCLSFQKHGSEADHVMETHDPMSDDGNGNHKRGGSRTQG